MATKKPAKTDKKPNTVHPAKAAATATLTEIISATSAVPQIGVAMPVNTDHVIAVAMMKIETDLTEARDHAMKAHNTHSAAATKHRNTLQALIKDAGTPELSARMESLLSALTVLGIKHKATYKIGSPTKNNTLPVTCELAVGGTYTSATVSGERPMTPQMLKLLENISETEKMAFAALSEATAARQRLGELAKMERQARAIVAEVALNQTSEGKALFEQILANVGHKFNFKNLALQLDNTQAQRFVGETIIIDSPGDDE